MSWHSGIICQEHHVERIMAKQNKTREEATQLMETIDAGRDNYVKRFTNLSRYDGAIMTSFWTWTSRPKTRRPK